jgi:hypothetical protein
MKRINIAPGAFISVPSTKGLQRLDRLRLQKLRLLLLRIPEQIAGRIAAAKTPEQRVRILQRAIQWAIVDSIGREAKTMAQTHGAKPDHAR